MALLDISDWGNTPIKKKKLGGTKILMLLKKIETTIAAMQETSILFIYAV